MSDRSFYIVVYDVVSDKRRLKVSHFLESLGDRVQYSVFELYLTDKELKQLLKRIVKLISEKEDAVRIYALCSVCYGKIHSLGQGEITKPPGLVIV
jgi:CRISPR-associated protein Cas2